MTGFRLHPNVAAAIFFDVQFSPEEHATSKPFYKSDSNPDDWYPIPDECFSDTTLHGTPANPALPMAGGNPHYDLSQPLCLADRTEVEMLRICMTICMHINWGLPDDVDTHCNAVNYDEHGETGKGHCHVYNPKKTSLLNYADPDCVEGSVNSGGMCTTNPGLTPRAWCSDLGTTPCGLYNTLALFCHFIGPNDVGPHMSRMCASGTSWSEADSECMPCEEDEYSMFVEDTPRHHPQIPRPADFPGVKRECAACPPGRVCGPDADCPYHSDPATCPELDELDAASMVVLAAWVFLA